MREMGTGVDVDADEGAGRRVVLGRCGFPSGLQGFGRAVAGGSEAGGAGDPEAGRVEGGGCAGRVHGAGRGGEARRAMAGTLGCGMEMADYFWSIMPLAVPWWVDAGFGFGICQQSPHGIM